MSKAEQDFFEAVWAIDTETTGQDPSTAEIVEFGMTLWDGQSWATSSQLVRPLDRIPAEASAKNCISNRMVAGQPTFEQYVPTLTEAVVNHSPRWLVAHNANYDQQILSGACQRAGQSELAAWFDQPDIWICTWRLSKRLLHHSFADTGGYGQNYLRYALDLPVDDSLAVHRAGPDSAVCAALLAKLVNVALEQGAINSKQPLGPQLAKLSQEHIPVPTWPIGKHKGQPIGSVPTDWFLWALDNVDRLNPKHASHDRDLLESVRVELETRLSGQE